MNKISYLLILLELCLTSIAQGKDSDFVVAKDGSGDFTTVQAAINAVPDYRKAGATRILIRKGIYKEKIVIAGSKQGVQLIGEDGAVLTYDDYANKPNIFGENKGTSGSGSIYIFGPDFLAENITFENSSGPVGQAVACHVAGDRAVFRRCRFLGFQDTLYTFGENTREYYEDCYIEGTVDFIFGKATCVFNRCELRSKRSGGFLTAPATPQGTKYGYVFYDCKLTADDSVEDGTVYLSRPWRPYAKAVFIRCEMGRHIKPEGWNNWGKSSNELTAYYAEYQSTGIGANPDKRAKWSHQLTDITDYDIHDVLKGSDEWNPTPSQYGALGFATVNADGQDGITGGMGGKVVHVKDREQLARYASASEPYTIIVDGRLEGNGLYRKYDIIELKSNKTIIGKKGAELAGIGLNIKNQQNIIIRNLIIHHADPDGIAARNSHHIWVDHCEVYSQDEARREDWDGLIDLTGGSSYLTVSYCYLHDHHKACLLNSGTGHFEDNGRNRATYHHNAFLHLDQRCPRVGYGMAHIFCNYYQNIGNYAIGMHTQARIKSEHNYFGNDVRHPFSQMYANSLDDASCAFLTDHGSHFSKPLKEAFRYQPTGNSFDPSQWYDSSFALDNTAMVANIHPAQTGPVEGLEHEPILWPGNGAIDQPTDLTLRYSEIEGMTATEVRIGTSPEKMRTVNPENLSLQPATTYYWQVAETNSCGVHTSPLYRFTTAPEKVSKPIPTDGERNARLRTAAIADAATQPMSLSWQRAAQAESYRVYLGTSLKEMENSHPASVNSTNYNPGTLLYGQTYYWRVDAVKADGTVVKGNIWSFSSPAALIDTGRTEAEHLARSAYAYLERQDGKWFVASNDSVVAGEAGPGALTGIWNGPDGHYNISIGYFDETNGQPWIGLSVNDKIADQWKGNKTDTVCSHNLPNSTDLKKGDQIRIDFYTQGKARCRIDYILITQ